MSKFTITSGAVVLDKLNRILLKLHPIRGWELPGRIVEVNETVHGRSECVLLIHNCQR
jgi:8-oxo-dGTP diphosphatase